MILAKNGFTFNSPETMCFEETAALVRVSEVKQSPGIGFARKDFFGKQNPKKHYTPKGVARLRVVELYKGWADGFSILTMPGMYWTFERQLLAGDKVLTWQDGRDVTQARVIEIHAVESDRAVFLASLNRIPSRKRGMEMTIDSVSTGTVTDYRFTSVEKYVRDYHGAFDGAWLDFTGFLTPARMKCVEELWSKLTSTLTVTLMEARTQPSVTRAIVKHGGIEHLLSNRIGTEPIDVYRYCDGVPMVQITWRKSEGRAA